MKRSELLLALNGAVTEEERRLLDEGAFTVGAFNRGVLCEMKGFAVERDAEIDLAAVEDLRGRLQRYLSEHMAEQPDGHKWIILASIFLSFVAERPMHPIDIVGIKVTENAQGHTVYECPEKSNDPKAVCRYCPAVKMSNYEIMKRRMQAEFARHDTAEMIGKFGLRHDDGYLYIRFFARDYRVSRESGTVEWSDDGFATVAEGGYNEAMTIYDVLCNSKPNCRCTGNMINMSNMSKVQSSGGSAGDGLFGRTVKWMDGKTPLLHTACRRMGGTTEKSGDAAYRLQMFDFLPVILRFWESDDEFPASLQLFVDSATTDFMHYETIWFALGHMLERIRGEMERAAEEEVSR